MENLKNLSSSSVRPIGHKVTDKIDIKKFVFMLLIVIIVGGAFGFVLSSLKGASGGSKNVGKNVTTEKTAGILDKKTFKDKAEGILKEGGVDGEGSFHLIRPGGQSQNVYLTSSTIDLSKYIDKKVRTWGVTFTAEKAGWLMDVGYIEVLN